VPIAEEFTIAVPYKCVSMNRRKSNAMGDESEDFFLVCADPEREQ
jgi:hypothetical protein